MHLFFSAKGRIPRHMWWIGLVCLVGANLLAGWILWRIFDVRLYLFFDGSFALFCVTLALLYPAYCLAAKRFQDRDRSPGNAKFVVAVGALKAVLDLFGITGDPWVPSGLDYAFLAAQIGLGLWFIAELGCLAGTGGKNRYGEDPLRPRVRYSARRQAH